MVRNCDLEFLKEGRLAFSQLAFGGEPDRVRQALSWGDAAPVGKTADLEWIEDGRAARCMELREVASHREEEGFDGGLPDVLEKYRLQLSVAFLRPTSHAPLPHCLRQIDLHVQMLEISVQAVVDRDGRVPYARAARNGILAPPR